MNKKRVLIVGIAGASLGTEIYKCLVSSEAYEIFGCDISALAYGLYEDGFSKVFCTDKSNYVKNIIEICINNKIDLIIPGAEEPTLLLAAQKKLFAQTGLILASNDPDVIKLCTDKILCFDFLANMDIRVPLFATENNYNEVFSAGIPCIVKPATGSGGSSFVFLAKNKKEASIYIEYLIRNNQRPMVQEYIPHEEGEFTIGTLVLGERIGSIALKRIFNSKLSILHKSKIGLISTGYSQGLIDDFTNIRQTCEKIAKKLGSKGPLNIQGRVKEGTFIPFEINPRFSASTYLRAMAGFNEIDLYIKFLLGEKVDIPKKIQHGYYLRSLTEKYINNENLK